MEKKIEKLYLTNYNLLIARNFMASSLSNLVNNLAERIQKNKCKYGHDNKKRETCKIKYKDCECCLEYTRVSNMI